MCCQTGPALGEESAAPPGFFSSTTVAALAADLRAGRVTAPALVEHALRAAAEHADLNAFVLLDEPGARTAALTAQRELESGRDRGSLHGIPVAVKDMIDVAGLPTGLGSRLYGSRVAERDAACVAALRSAGMVVVGKTNTHELAYGPTGDRSAAGPTRNPHRRTAMSGGSSAGSAAAIAAGVVPLALGTDTGGSVRIPSACCGVVGLKTTNGRLSVDGVFPLSASLDIVGPMARTAADCALAWQALSGEPPTEFAGTPRIGWLAPFHVTSAEVTALARRTAERLGPTVAAAVPAAALHTVYRTIQSSETYAVHADRAAAFDELLDPEVAARIRVAAEVRGWEYVRALRERDELRAAFRVTMADHDVLALPTVPFPAPPIDARTVEVDGVAVDVRAGLLSLTSPWNVLGVPAISVPAGLVDGLPVGLQLVAAPGGEGLLLALADRLTAGSAAEG